MLSITGKYSLLGVFLFMISLGATLSLGTWYGHGADMMFSVVPFNIACFVSLSSVRIRLASLVAGGAVGGAIGAAVGAACLALARPQAFGLFGVLMFAFPAVDGIVMGASAGILIWIMYAVLKHVGTSRKALLVQSCSVVIALTVVSTLWIVVADEFKY